MAFALLSSVFSVQVEATSPPNNRSKTKCAALPWVIRSASGPAIPYTKQEAASRTQSRSFSPPSSSVTPGYVPLAVLLGLDSGFLDEAEDSAEGYAQGEFSNETGDRDLEHNLRALMFLEHLRTQNGHSCARERVEPCASSLPPSSPTLSDSSSFTSSTGSLSRQSSFYSTCFSLGSPRSTTTADSSFVQPSSPSSPSPSLASAQACSPHWPALPTLSHRSSTDSFASYTSAGCALWLLSRAPPVAIDTSPRRVKSDDEPPRPWRKLRNAAEYRRRAVRAHEERRRKRQERMDRTEYFCSGSRTLDYMMTMSCEDEDDD
ncbi:hypothetical protein JCM1840_004358 [Sporobolomyces johnsonii]